MNAHFFSLFFQLPYLKKILFGVEVTPAYQVIKTVQNRSTVALHAIPLHAATASKCN